MAAPPNIPYATHQKDVLNGSSRQQGQTPFQGTVHCPRCVRMCVKCQRGPLQGNGYSPPHPTQGAVQQHQHTCQGSCLPPTYKSSGHSQNDCHGQAFVPLDNCSDQSFQDCEQQPFDRTPSDVSQTTVEDDVQECKFTKAEALFSRPPLHGMSMQEKITEEATVDETTEKTSFMPSQRDSGLSTWQDASRLGRQQEFEDTSQSEGMQSHECSEKEFRSAAMQASLLHEELCEPLSSVTEKLGDRSDGMESEGSEEECKENLDQDPFVNECTPPERPPPSHPRRHHEEQRSCEQVTDCLQRCSEKLEEIQHSPDCNLQRNSPDEYLKTQSPPAKREKICEMPSAPVAAPPISCTQTEIEYTRQPSCGSFQKNSCNCTRQCSWQAETTSRSSYHHAPVHNLACEMAKELQNSVKPSSSKISCEETRSVKGLAALKQGTHGISETHSECTTKESRCYKALSSTIESHSYQQLGPTCSTAYLGDTEKNLSQSKEETTKTGSTTKTESPSTQQSCIRGQDGFALQSEDDKKEYSTQQACTIKASSKYQTQHEDLVPQSVDSERKSMSSKDQISQMESFSKEQSGTFEQLPSELSDKKTSPCKDVPSTTVIHHPALGILRHPSDSTVIKCTLTRENLSLCKQLCDKMKRIPAEETQPQRTQSKQSETLRSSQSTSTSRQLQTHESPRKAELKRKAPQHEPGSRKTGSHQDALLKRLSSRQEALSKKSVSRQEMTSKKPVLKRTVSQQESFSKNSACAHPIELSDGSESRTQMSEKLTDSTSMQCKEQNIQSSKHFVPIRMDNKIVRTQSPRRNSEASPIQSPFDQKEGSGTVYKQSERSRAMAYTSLAADQTSSTTNTSSGLALQQVSQTPDSDQIPLRSQQKSNIKNTPSRSKSVSLHNTDELNSAHKNPARANTPPKSDTAKTSGLTANTNDIQNRDDRSQPVANSFVSEKRSSTAVEVVEKDSDMPQPYCLQAYYLPLYQCAYCQQVTPYPVTCQFGFASCPSPCESCLYQPCQTTPCLIYPYPMYAQSYTPQKPHDGQLEPVGQFSKNQTDQKDCSQPFNFEFRPSRAPCPTDAETNDRWTPCTSCDEQCGSHCQPREPCKTCEVDSGDNDYRNGKNSRRSLESDQLDLQSLPIKLPKSITIDSALGGTFRNRSTAISDTSESGLVKRKQKSELLRETKGTLNDMNRRTGRANSGRKKLRNEQGRYEKPRRETITREGTDKRDSINVSIDKKRKFRRIQPKIISEGAIIENQKSPPHSNSAYSKYQYSTVKRSQTINEDMTPLLYTKGGGQFERLNAIRMTQKTDREGHQNSNRTMNPNFFEKMPVRFSGTYGIARGAKYRASHPLPGLAPRNALRKQSSPPHKETNRMDEIDIESHCPHSRKFSINTKRKDQQWMESTYTQCCCQKKNARSEHHKYTIAEPNDKTSQKNTSQTKDEHIKTMTSSNFIPSYVHAVSRQSNSRKCGSLDRKNLSCSYNLRPSGTPEQDKSWEMKKYLNTSNQDMPTSSEASEQKLPFLQSKHESTPSPSSALSTIRYSATCHPGCNLQIDSTCCTEWTQDITLPDHQSCRAYAWADVLNHMGTLHPHLSCPRDGYRMSKRRRHTKAKPLLLHSQRARLAVMRGKRLLQTQTT